MSQKIPVLALLVATVSFNAAAKSDRTNIIYGEDNRVETYQASFKHQNLASSTAGMIENIKLIDLGGSFMLPPTSIKSSMGLCEDERFSEQPTSAICSGFLVGPDLLVTAGHCVTSQQRCDEVTFFFDYKVNEQTNRADMIIPADQVYKCAKVIDAKLEGSGGNTRDYALVKLDRVVKGKTPLKFRTQGKVKTQESIVVIGHPSGLPQKVAPGANIYRNDAESFFVTNLDTFGGNSGSAVFNEKTGVVEGILVRGAKDYVGDDKLGCARVNNEQLDITDRLDLGESVSRITDIPTLKNRDAFFSAIEKGNIRVAMELREKIADINIINNDQNTALHIAAKYGRTAIVQFLIGENAHLDIQNKNGETPLHLAAFYNKKAIATKLVAAGADVLIRDKFGVFASERTNYLSFKLRNALRKVQKLEKNKRRNKR